MLVIVDNLILTCFQGNKQRGENASETKIIISSKRRKFSGLINFFVLFFFSKYFVLYSGDTYFLFWDGKENIIERRKGKYKLEEGKLSFKMQNREHAKSKQIKVLIEYSNPIP